MPIGFRPEDQLQGARARSRSSWCGRSCGTVDSPWEMLAPAVSMNETYEPFTFLSLRTSCARRDGRSRSFPSSSFLEPT
jgi:hypothetical protein